MRTYLVLFFTSLVSTLVLTRVVRARAIAWGAVDLPDDKRRIHKTPIPRWGGVAIYLSLLLSMLTLPLLDTLVSHGVRANWRTLLTILVPATMIFLLGVVDDMRGMTASVKLAFEFLAASMLYANGFRIEVVSMPVIGSVEFPDVVGYGLTVLWVIGLTNAFNLIDGIDGLATGASGFAMLSVFVFSLTQGHPEVSVISIALLGGTLGFLRYNFNPATIFLGDSGSLLLGFMAAALSMVTTQKSPTLIAIAIPLVSFGLPVAEVFLSILRRFLSGEPIFQSDRRHIHHMLLRRGLNQRQTAILLYGICALFSLFGIMLINPQRSLGGLIFLILGIGIVFGVQHLHYDEFGELAYQIRHGMSRRRRVLTVNVRIRRSTESLRRAATPEELNQALTEILEAGDFDGVHLEVGDRDVIRAACSEPTGWRFEEDRMVAVWQWRRADLFVRDLASSQHFWSLHIPLSDRIHQPIGSLSFYRALSREDLAANLTQVCGDLRTDLIAAIERICEPAPSSLPAAATALASPRSPLGRLRLNPAESKK